ncbi:aspartate aminotransferase [Micromonas commoda]|uniref:Aspartate aminotransferase n=1 Tax=Micromonas commoda (strain RCC299 / NOUM17 / CCMP2709) TaxID=296587 RepID=C1EES7_MICCC|nr:aspartate aminotransferase [Micromonas commoda]ACO66584.1 aspartate aminotransferase [Micromonas commoda]|eukprot:XP_002505326.1 aspartate aminotransferase [Micromonas commoda]
MVANEALAASLRASQVPPFKVMEVMIAAHARELAGLPVLHMEVGQPSDGAPAHVCEASKRALDACAAGRTTLGYTISDGIDPLRAAIARDYETQYGVAVDPADVMVTTGSSAAFVLGFTAAFDHGDRVAIATPGYPAYRNILEALGVEVVSIPVDASTNFQPTVGLLDAALDGKPIKGLIVASPSNPTGTVLTRAELFELIDWCKSKKVWFVSDEIYHKIEYGEERATTALEAPGGAETCLVINSFSKYHCMTGWRVGWAVVPPALQPAMRALQQNLFINAPNIAQIAAAAALDPECDAVLRGHVAKYARNREILMAGLPEAGFTKLSSAGGAYYIYADVSDLSTDSIALCKRILDVTGVACVSGVDFDRERGHHFVRFSFCGSTETCEEAVRILREKREEWQKH